MLSEPGSQQAWFWLAAVGERSIPMIGNTVRARTMRSAGNRDFSLRSK